MQAYKDILATLGIRTDGVLLPVPGTDLSRWAVVACDQYTSEPEYWNRVEAHVGDAPSTLRLIFPEVWLDRETEARKQDRIGRINDTMSAYLEAGLLAPQKGLLLTERITREGHRRIGLMLSLDLERYDFSVGSQSLIRATEGTILDRLPPRIRIREHAGLELPHIMILIDDPDATVIEPLHAAACTGASTAAGNAADGEGIRSVYDFSLMENSGHLHGWTIEDASLIEGMAKSLARLADPAAFQSRYGTDCGTGVLLYAVGDGNHSLATAKSCWEQLKKELPATALADHPARYALIELVNVHDAGLVFEPIHRVLFGAERTAFLADFSAWHNARGIRTSVSALSPDADASVPVPSGSEQRCTMITPEGVFALQWENPSQQLAVGSLQAFLDDWMKAHPKSMLDYVHGGEVTGKLGSEPGNLGFLLPVMGKEALFPTVIRDGALPRKTFSMGEAHEKRFYLECRRIR